jgi:hypothetical protein
MMNTLDSYLTHRTDGLFASCYLHQHRALSMSLQARYSDAHFTDLGFVLRQMVSNRTALKGLGLRRDGGPRSRWHLDL